MGAEEIKPFDLMEFVQSIFDKIKIEDKQGLYISGADAVIRVDLTPHQGNVYIRFNGIDMGFFEPYGRDDATQGYLCVFKQQHRRGTTIPEEDLMMNIVKRNEYVRVY